MTAAPILPTLAEELESRGVAPVSTARHWRPWSWEKQRRLYFRLGYVPSPGQRAFHQSTARVKVAVAGARFGKSIMASYDVLPVILSPGTNLWVLGPTYDLAEKEWRYITEALEKLGIMEMAVVRQAGKPSYLEFPWGARVWTRSADNPASLLGEELDAIILSEASQLPERVWTRYVRARIGSRLGRVLIPTTPFGFNWIRGQWDRGMRQRGMRQRGEQVPWHESVAAWQFSVLENPHFDPSEYFAARRDLPPEEFAEQYDGRFVSLVGRVFPQFVRARHVVGHVPERLENLPVYRTIDFGYANPACCLWVVWDREGDEASGIKPGTFWVVGELYARSLLVEQLADRIKSHPWSVGKRIAATYGDMADAQARATLTAHGVAVSADGTRIHGGAKVPIDKSVMEGLSTIRTLFHRDQIRISESAPNLIRELAQYSFAEGRDMPAPDQDDHAIDPLRYLLHTIWRPARDPRDPSRPLPMAPIPERRSHAFR